ncbi:calmodulin-binding protein 25 [Humulus lupulus]|uniref:calmodulin-binding protein 25 n=1 Tax=Humulus lupulus TaxID=3486 RepID=UPI002B401D92|nr:calmodulin-binding protein 25 [Humulus lupulus]
MASSENLASTIEPWAFRPTFVGGDCWFSELFTRDADSITKALQKSLSNSTNQPETPLISPTSFSDGPFKPDLVQTPTVSGISGSDPELFAPKRQRVNPVVPPTSTMTTTTTGKVSKRKSRATKRSQTTFITADPANFRQMVQQVTGVRFGSAQFPTAASAPILKPEPQRPCSRFPITSGCLPTLDTSAFLLDQQPVVGSMSSLVSSAPPLSTFSPGMGGDGVLGAGGGLDFDTFPSFPTLESWKVM